MKIKWFLICLFVLCVFEVWPVSGLSQTIPRSGHHQVIIQSRSGTNGLVIGKEVYRLVPDATILDLKGRKIRFDRIPLPSDATVRFVETAHGETMIGSVKLEVFTK